MSSIGFLFPGILHKLPGSNRRPLADRLGLPDLSALPTELSLQILRGIPGGAGSDRLMEVCILRLTCGMSGPLVRQDGIGPSSRIRTIPESKPACLVCLRVSPEGLERRGKEAASQLLEGRAGFEPAACCCACSCDPSDHLPPMCLPTRSREAIQFLRSKIGEAGLAPAFCGEVPSTHRLQRRLHKTAFGPHMITKWYTP